MSDQTTTQHSPEELDRHADEIATIYRRQILVHEVKTRLAQLKRDEAQAQRDELIALTDIYRAKGRLRQLALETDMITVEEATKVRQQPQSQKPKSDQKQ